METWWLLSSVPAQLPDSPEMKTGAVMVWMVGWSAGLYRGQYRECERGECRYTTDRLTDFQFDQPRQLYLDTVISSQLEQGHRYSIYVVDIL